MSYDIQTVHGVLLFFILVSLMIETAPAEFVQLPFRTPAYFKILTLITPSAAIAASSASTSASTYA